MDRFIIFLHIQKCAGLTIQRMLRRRYGPSVPRRLLNKMRNASRNGRALADYSPDDQYIQGHFCYGVHRELPQPYTYFTLLREPVARLVSLYVYSKTNPTAYYHGQAKDASIEEFLIETPLMELDNGMTRFLAGDPEDTFINRTPIGSCDRALFEKALANVERDFFLVGIVEEFDRSVLLLAEALNWTNALYLRRNTRSTEKPEVSPELVQQLKERNKWDVELYEHCRARLVDTYREKIGSDQALKDFQAANRRFNRVARPIYNIYDNAKAVLSGNANRPT